MVEVYLSKKADRDLEEILTYSIESFGSRVADKYQAALRDSLRRIGQNPKVGEEIVGRSRTYFKFSCQRHAIFYYQTRRGLVVARILHLAMDFTRHLAE